jgi:hypothetical protein
MSSCTNYGPNFAGYGCGPSYTYLLTNFTCVNDGGCSQGIVQTSGEAMKCH